MKSKKIIIIDKIDNIGVKNLKKYFRIKYFGQKISNREIENVYGLLVKTKIISKDYLKKFKNLKIISKHGVGVDNIDLDYCKKLNIRVFIAEHANKITVAEHIFFMLLILARNLLHYDQITRSGNFLNDKKIKLSKELAYKKTLIFGFGRIGKEVAKRCLSFDMDTYAYDPYINKKYFKLHKIKSIKKLENLAPYDFILICSSLTNKSKNFFNRKRLSSFKRGGIIINCSRGEIINEKDLNILSKKKNFFAGIDVFKNEPPKKNEYLQNKNIFFSPHAATFTKECLERMSIQSCQNIISFYKNAKYKDNLFKRR